jgi:hypothetical protein
MADDDTNIGRLYTRSRRFPKFIGKLLDGTKIPLGPYTLTQGVLFGIALVIAVTTKGMWGSGQNLLDLVVAVGVSWGLAWAAGFIPITRRNLLSVLTGVINAYSRPVDGTYRGRGFKARKPSFAAGKAHVISTPASAELDQVSAAPLAETPEPRQTALPAPTEKKTMTAVERLLQQARNS